MRSSVLLAGAALGAATVVARPRRARRSFEDAADPRRRHLLGGAVLDRYLAEGGPAGALGLPISGLRPATPDPSTPLGADREIAFTGGTIYLDGSAGGTFAVTREVPGWAERDRN